MRIAHLVIGGDVAGGQMVALQLGSAARDAGHDVSFVSPSEGPFVALVRERGFTARIVPLRSALDPDALLRLVRALRADRIDLVHTHGHFGVNVLGRVAARLVGARALSHMHIENSFRGGFGRSAQIALDNATARLCFALVAVSDATRERLLRQGYPQDKLFTVHNGIAPADVASPRRLANGPTVLEIGRLAEVKGQRVLLAAVARLDATAVLVGGDLEQGGDYAAQLRTEAEQLGIADRVVLAGYRSDVAALLAGCDVFCLPSLAEGMPLVVLEAMLQARPVVANAVGGTGELVVDGETGILVPPRDVDALANALSTLLSDSVLAERMGAAGRQRVLARFTEAATAAAILRLYEGSP